MGLPPKTRTCIAISYYSRSLIFVSIRTPELAGPPSKPKASNPNKSHRDKSEHHSCRYHSDGPALRGEIKRLSRIGDLRVSFEEERKRGKEEGERRWNLGPPACCHDLLTAARVAESRFESAKEGRRNKCTCSKDGSREDVIGSIWAKTRLSEKACTCTEREQHQTVYHGEAWLSENIEKNGWAPQ